MENGSLNPSDNTDGIQNPLLNYVNELTRSVSIANVRDARLQKHSFKQKAKQVQNVAALTKMFNEKGKSKSCKKWKLLLQH